MTAENRKQYIEGWIQNFDVVSLYRSEILEIPGVLKLKPKVISSDILEDELMSLDIFFIETNIKKIAYKSKYPYKFGQVFHKSDFL